MPIKAEVKGKTFRFPDGTSPEVMGAAIDDFFSRQAPVQPAGPRTRRAVQERRQAVQTGVQDLSRQIETGQISAQDLPLEQVEQIQRQRIEQLPELAEVGVSQFADTEGLEGFGSTLAAFSALEPREAANILAQRFPQVGVVQTPDNQFILVNNDTGAAVNVNRPGLTTMDLLQGAGLIAAFTPTGRAAALGGGTIAGRAGAVGAASAGTEAALQAGQALAGGEFDAGEVALAGGLGGVAEAAVPATRALLQRREQARQAQAITPEGEARQQLIEETLGTPATRAQVTQAPSDFQLQQEIIKGSDGAARQVVDAQTEAIQQRLIDAAEQTGGTIGRTDSTAINEVVNRSLELDKQVSDIYRQVRETLPDTPSINVAPLRDTIKKLDPLDTLSNGTVTALKREADRLGFLQRPSGRITAGATVERRNLKTPGQAEALRIFANSLFEGANPKGREVIRRFKDDLDKMVLSGAGRDFFSQARNAKRSFEEGLTRAGVSKFDRRGKNLVRDMLENKISPDNFTADVLNKAQWRTDDIKQLRTYLEQTNTGQQALADMKADAFEFIRDKSFNAKGELNGATMIKTINAMRGKLGELLSPDEQLLLDRLKEVVILRTPRRSEAIGLGPSGQLVRSISNRYPVFSQIFESLKDWQKNRLALKLPPRFKEGPQIPDVQVPAAALQPTRLEGEQ